MSESTQTSETTPQEQQQPQPVKKKQYQQGGNRDERHNYHQQRPHYRRPNRAPYVEDLREKLNRIRREKDEVKNGFLLLEFFVQMSWEFVILLLLFRKRC